MLGYNMNQTVYEIALEFFWFRDFEMLLFVQEWIGLYIIVAVLHDNFLLRHTEISF